MTHKDVVKETLLQIEVSDLHGKKKNLRVASGTLSTMY